MIDLQYGPTTSGKCYLAIHYHQPTSKKTGKSRWKVDGSVQFLIFSEADLNSQEDPRGSTTYFGFFPNCSTKLGKDNERIAKFVGPASSINWHGYPIYSSEERFSEDFLNHLESTGKINNVVRRRIARGVL